MRALFAVDWDDTCVEDRWPDQGDWLPGAVEALHELSRHGDIVIHSCRVSEMAFPSRRVAAEDVRRDPADVQRSIDGIRDMLVKAGLGHVEVWTRSYKPAATVYIDNRAVQFNGDWSDTLDRTYYLLSRCATQGGRTHLVRAREKVSAGVVFGPEGAEEIGPQTREYIDVLRREIEDTVDGGTAVPAALRDPESMRHPSSQSFVDRVMAWVSLHDQKQKDYGSATDPFANVRGGAKKMGLPGWVGAVIRMNDKMERLNKAAKQWVENGEITLANEGVIDSFDDMGVYSGIGATLFEEEV